MLPHHPLVLAAALFLLGVTLGPTLIPILPWLLTIATASLFTWPLTEKLRRPRLAQSLLALTTLLAGTSLYQLNQQYTEPTHIARLATDDEFPITLRATLLALPENTSADSHGNAPFLARTTQILTTTGWSPATGDILISWNSPTTNLHPNTAIELYGWLSRPRPTLNPGGINARKNLAADRIFAQVRIPRSSGLIPLEPATAATSNNTNFLARTRLWLRAKLLQHLLRDDVPAAYTLTALLLGARDPAIADISQAFADAGVAHLLAISGSHIVFFAGVAFFLLRFIPMRPRWRELLVALLLGAYVLATPCGPPILRAAIALLMLLLARWMGRPRDYLNMLAAAAIVILLLRPTDLFDAGFQLSFAATAGLILLAERLHRALFAKWLERETLVAELAATPLTRYRLRAYRVATALLVANLIGACTAAPLVAFHFGQINLWAIITGIIAIPFVSAAMIVAALQLALEILATNAGAFLSPLSAAIGHIMIWIVQKLAALPGAAIPLRSPPAWLVAAIYAALILCIVRQRLKISRAFAANILLATLTLATAWYTLTAPRGNLQLTALSAGQSTTLLLRTPEGNLLLLDAGTPRTSQITTLLAPALRLQGTRQLDALLLTALDTNHAAGASTAVEAYRPRTLFLSTPSWSARGETLAGAGLAQVVTNIPPKLLKAGDTLDLGRGTHIEILWPPATGDLLAHPELILTLEYQHHKILLADPVAIRPLALILLAHTDLRCEGVLFTGIQRGTGDATLRQIIAPLQSSWIVWTGRGPWAQKHPNEGEWNTADRAVVVTIDENGRANLSPHSP